LNNTGDVYQNFIYKNGTAFSNNFEQGISDSNGQTNMHYTMYMSLTAGDTVDIYARWTGGGSGRTANNYSSNAWWAIWRLT
jgi:tartrate dehydratase alpha subunit/fumarate hydratase class I-like protein